MLEQHGTDPTEARRDPGYVFARIESADRAELEQALAASHSTLASVDLAVRYRRRRLASQLWLPVLCLAAAPDGERSPATAPRAGSARGARRDARRTGPRRHELASPG
ncbi:MAG: hypothetical protein U5K43_07590 [Halofilum sp. (in: g-proteobacteria)]|nr:hypothetical protein [Halofilum sp. (in: g-proteobacteria)]